ncbi:MAG: pilin [Patescibacteria group bacterium]
MKRLLYSLLLVAILVPQVSLAAGTSTTPTTPQVQAPTSLGFVPLTSIPGIESAGNSATLPDFLNNLYKLAIGVAAVLAVLQIVRAGIMYMGGDSVWEKKEAKSLIALSVGGLILILSPVIVFSLINPKILELKIDGLDTLGDTRFGKDDTTPPVDTATDQQLAGYIQLKAESLPAGKSCKDILGIDWENVPTTPLGSTINTCALLPAGQTCCGRLRQSPTAPVLSDGTITFYTAEESTDLAKLGSPRCLLYKKPTFSSVNLCSSARLSATANCNVVLIENCSGFRPSLTSQTPVWKDIKDLPTCSQ